MFEPALRSSARPQTRPCRVRRQWAPGRRTETSSDQASPGLALIQPRLAIAIFHCGHRCYAAPLSRFAARRCRSRGAPTFLVTLEGTPMPIDLRKSRPSLPSFGHAVERASDGEARSPSHALLSTARLVAEVVRGCAARCTGPRAPAADRRSERTAEILDGSTPAFRHWVVSTRDRPPDLEPSCPYGHPHRRRDERLASTLASTRA